jgi:hypothetical protein
MKKPRQCELAGLFLVFVATAALPMRSSAARAALDFCHPAIPKPNAQ